MRHSRLEFWRLSESSISGEFQTLSDPTDFIFSSQDCQSKWSLMETWHQQQHFLMMNFLKYLIRRLINDKYAYYFHKTIRTFDYCLSQEMVILIYVLRESQQSWKLLCVPTYLKANHGPNSEPKLLVQVRLQPSFEGEIGNRRLKHGLFGCKLILPELKFWWLLHKQMKENALFNWIQYLHSFCQEVGFGEQCNQHERLEPHFYPVPP